jgi:hypothetical protein
VNPAHRHFILSSAVEKLLDRFELGGGGIGVDRKKGGPPSSQPPKRLQRKGESVSREGAKVIIFKKFRPDPCFLDCGGLTPLWIFPSSRSLSIQSSVKPEHSKTPSLPQNVLGNCGTL